MNNATGTAAPLKRPYSSPTIALRPLSSLAELVWKRSAEDEGQGGNGLRAGETLVRTLTVEGFQQELQHVVDALASLGWSSRIIPERGVDSVEKLRERAKIPASDGISILLTDVRRDAAARVSPVIRIELEGGPRATLILVLSDPIHSEKGSTAAPAAMRWRIRGPITSEELGVVIHSIVQIPSRSPARA